MVAGMSRHQLAASLSQINTVNYTEFPDEFEENIQLQVSQLQLITRPSLNWKKAIVDSYWLNAH